MAMKKTYYKVTDSKLRSIYSPLIVQYIMGEFVEARYTGTPLCVFDSIENVAKFIDNEMCSSPRIFECEIRGRYRVAWIPSKPTEYTFSFVGKILKLKKMKKKFLHLVDVILPCGTVSVKMVKLTKEVDKDGTPLSDMR